MTSSPAARRTRSPSTWSCTDHQTPIRWPRYSLASAAPLQPHLGSGAYANYLVNEPRERVRQAYGAETYDRLVALKDRFDPTNVFRLNQNIEPTAPVL